MIKLLEPVWWIKLLEELNELVHSNEMLKTLVPFTADIFVFSYPIYLVVFYLYGKFQKETDYKEYALYIFFSSISAVAINLFIQQFIDKSRPEQIVLSKENLIFEHVPDAPFPSDHAAISFAIAMASTLVAIKEKNKTLLWVSIMLWIFAITMGLSRIAAGVHWPTDILWWAIIWIVSAVIFFKDTIFSFFKRNIFSFLIKLEEKIFSLFGVK